MATAVGFLEMLIFLYLASKTFKDTDKIIDNILFCYICQILNYKLFGSVPWLSVGITFFGNDFMILLMLFIWAHKGLKSPQKQYTLWISVFVFMALQSALRGAMAFGLTSEFFGDLRRYVYFSIGILYFWNVPLKRPLLSFEKKIDRVFWGITIYAAVILVFYFLGMPIGERSSERPLLANDALVYAAFVAVKWYKDLVMSRHPYLSTSTLAFTVILILNRFNTTWMALLAAVAIILVFRHRDKNRHPLSLKFYLQFLLLIGGGYLFLNLASDTYMLQELTESANKFNLNEDNTFSGRVELWGLLLETAKGVDAVLGSPLGSGFRVLYRGSYWLASPHNGYIETILRTGYVGIGAIILGMIAIIRKAYTNRSILPIALCLMCMVFWVTYSLTFEGGMIIGLCARYVFMNGRRT